jgi:hypothetical protein
MKTENFLVKIITNSTSKTLSEYIGLSGRGLLDANIEGGGHAVRLKLQQVLSNSF